MAMHHGIYSEFNLISCNGCAGCGEHRSCATCTCMAHVATRSDICLMSDSRCMCTLHDTETAARYRNAARCHCTCSYSHLEWVAGGGSGWHGVQALWAYGYTARVGIARVLTGRKKPSVESAPDPKSVRTVSDMMAVEPSMPLTTTSADC